VDAGRGVPSWSAPGAVPPSSDVEQLGTGRQGRQPMGATAPPPIVRSRWSLDLVRNFTIFEVSSTESGDQANRSTLAVRQRLLPTLPESARYALR